MSEGYLRCFYFGFQIQIFGFNILIFEVSRRFTLPLSASATTNKTISNSFTNHRIKDSTELFSTNYLSMEHRGLHGRCASAAPANVGEVHQSKGRCGVQGCVFPASKAGLQFAKPMIKVFKAGTAPDFSQQRILFEKIAAVDPGQDHLMHYDIVRLNKKEKEAAERYANEHAISTPVHDPDDENWTTISDTIYTMDEAIDFKDWTHTIVLSCKQFDHLKDGLRMLHKASITHNDLPENVMLRNFMPIIVDFDHSTMFPFANERLQAATETDNFQLYAKFTCKRPRSEASEVIEIDTLFMPSLFRSYTQF